MRMMSPEKESIWNDSKYAPSRKPRTGPKAAMLYIQPRKKIPFQYWSLKAFIESIYKPKEKTERILYYMATFHDRIYVSTLFSFYI